MLGMFDIKFSAPYKKLLWYDLKKKQAVIYGVPLIPIWNSIPQYFIAFTVPQKHGR